MSKPMNPATPLLDIFPKSWKKEMSPCSNLAFRNLQHFKHYVSKLTQENDEYCDITYADALKELLQGKSNFPEAEQADIRNLVRSNLHKRGLITEEVYENFRYSTDGTKVDVDVGKYAAGEADCVITPGVQYVDFFYELYISISYSYDVPNSLVRENVAKLLATIEELERQHIFIKIVLIFPDRNCNRGEGPANLFSSIPLFSHKDPKDVETMSSVINDRLLRKFYFAVLEDFYGKDLASGYGKPVNLEGCMNIGKTFNEVDFFTEIQAAVGLDTINL